ncbi:hypothetical protein J2752_001380 [Halarchaeum rubridurum]|uniref:Uncharacterized protein n=1 Tax=Halarchaeum rubridurum TaxID=489911 RepID=A0A830FL45_9EURY|nr:hypothetical protein [Halarchaeum rubridurum]MBP1954468.1 hypothetical protein [Halarchaeum rubridurum]GGM61251.1 hypothetical protein GCM10009017_09240 [Halarchaeum rubridurum]
MKPGASDPFADDEEDERVPVDEDEAADEPTDEPSAGAAEASGADGVDDADGTGDAGTTDAAASDESAAGESGDAAGGADEPVEFPYIYRRDKVKDERPDVHQLFVRDETDTLARDAERDLEKLLGEDVYRLDAREAIYLAGMRHLDEAADVLREWGYDR